MLFDRSYLFGKFNFISLLKRNPKKLLDQQNSIFLGLGFNRKSALIKLNQILVDNFGKEYDQNNGMWSEHLLLFSALSISDSSHISKILEIGTFNGETAFILSELFPSAQITTIDLNNSDLKEIKEYSYAFESSDSNFISNREKTLQKKKNINFIQMNSLNLFKSNEKYDLIWIDGAHGFPFIAVDLTNALRLIDPDGFILCDDVYLSTEHNSMMTDSLASWITLIQFKKASNLKLELIPKRIGQHNKKFVAVVQI